MFDPSQKVPARYVGDQEKLLSSDEEHHDGDGNKWSTMVTNSLDQRPDLGIRPQDSIMVYPQEVYGQTYKHDRVGNAESIWVGLGKVCLAQDAGRTEDELRAIGYDFHEKRRDMEPLIPLAELLKQATKPPETAVAANPEPPVQAAPITQPIPVVPEPVDGGQTA